MKRFFGIFLLCILPLIFCSCAKSEFVQLNGFVMRYNEISENERISVSDIEYTTLEGGGVLYTVPFERDGERILLRLVEDADKRIGQIRAVMPKCDEKGKKLPCSDTRLALFSSVCETAVSAFTLCDASASAALLDQFGFSNAKTFEAEGELTKDEGSFHYVYLSAPLCCEFMVYNRWLCSVETTNKPQSRPAFGDNTSIRTQTVPLS